VSLIWIEILVGFGVPLAWGVWQLIDLRREREKDAAIAAAREREAAASPDQPQPPLGG
jgi:hypothetical protein